MFKFNNNHIFTGYLKQLLASFHLPKCRIYTKEQQQFADSYTERKAQREDPENGLQVQLNTVTATLEELESKGETIQEAIKTGLSEVERAIESLLIGGLPATQQQTLLELNSDLVNISDGILVRTEDLIAQQKLISETLHEIEQKKQAGEIIDQLQAILNAQIEELPKIDSDIQRLQSSQATLQQRVVEMLLLAEKALSAEQKAHLKAMRKAANTYINTQEKFIAKKTKLEGEKATLQNLLVAPVDKELNVIQTNYHSSYEVYPGAIGDEDSELAASLSYRDSMRYIPYIKDGFLQVYTTNGWAHCHSRFNSDHLKYHEAKNISFTTTPYSYGQKILNYTKNLQIQNTVYDSYTHEYLGDYLRFHRDFANINLMPLYNCFSNRACPHLDIDFELTNSYTVKFKTDQQFETTLYKYYMVPVKFFKDYTIAIDSHASVEICCCIYDEYQNTDTAFKDVPQLTYQCFSDLQFSKPVLYTKLQNLNSLLLNSSCLAADLAQQEDNLKLILKVPATAVSSIVILEGDYTTYNDSVANLLEGTKKTNRSIINYENLEACERLADRLITPLQLLRTNTGESYPFADRLVEYLIGNAITVNEEIQDNITRAKRIISTNCNPAVHTMTTDDGIWEPILQCLTYDYINEYKNTHDVNHDILGFIDKDVEKWYSAYGETPETIANVDIYTTKGANNEK